MDLPTIIIPTPPAAARQVASPVLCALIEAAAAVARTEDIEELAVRGGQPQALVAALQASLAVEAVATGAGWIEAGARVQAKLPARIPPGGATLRRAGAKGRQGLRCTALLPGLCGASCLFLRLLDQVPFGPPSYYAPCPAATAGASMPPWILRAAAKDLVPSPPAAARAAEGPPFGGIRLDYPTDVPTDGTMVLLFDRPATEQVSADEIRPPAGSGLTHVLLAMAEEGASTFAAAAVGEVDKARERGGGAARSRDAENAADICNAECSSLLRSAQECGLGPVTYAL